MKTSDGILIAGGALLLLWFFSNKASAQTASQVALDDGTTFDFTSLQSQYGADNVNRLASLYMAMQVNGLTRLQAQLMLSQALFESGLFTDNPNYYNMDTLHNFAGITGNSRFPAAPGSIYAAYPNLQAFVRDWLTILNYNNEPINATGVFDFVTRLKENGYFTSSTTTYYAGVNGYYNLLTSISNQA